MADEGRCSLIDLLNKTERDDRERPQIFKYGADGKLCTENLIGVFEYRTEAGIETVIIGDRFGPKKVANDGVEGEFLSFFAWAMLEKCWDDTPLWILKESRISGETNIFDRILLLKLAVQMEQAWKKGRFRIYRAFSCYDSRIRGQLDLPRKIRMSMGLDDGKMAYRVREYSEDNIYNHLFFQACLEAEKRHPEWMRRLRQRIPGFRLARQALERQNAGWSRGDTRSLLDGTKKKITNPVYRDYETLRVVARAVLKRTSHRSYPYAENGASFVTGVFLDVSKLWEDYLYKAVIHNSSCLAQNNADILGGMLNVRPDFWWENKRRVLDAKYRPVWGRILEKAQKKEQASEQDRKRIRDDVYQVLTYMLTLDCTHGGVIFPVKRKRPTAEPSADKKNFQHKGFRAVRKGSPSVSGNPNQSFGLIPFFVPQDEKMTYREFFKAMELEANKTHEELEAFFGTN
ncbi:MAG: hypothetical protein HDT33_07255 [Clostridiales bacterium]|nr:hypothetical protein [Clostridiales bacterium]